MNDEIVVIYMREFRKNIKSNKIGYGKKVIYHDCVFTMPDGEMLFSYISKYYEELSNTQPTIIPRIISDDDNIKVFYDNNTGVEFSIEYLPVFKEHESENEVKHIDLEIVKLKKNRIVSSRTTRRYRLGTYIGDMSNIKNEINIEDIKLKVESIIENIMANNYMDGYNEVLIKRLEFDNIINDNNPIGILMLRSKSDNGHMCFNLSIEIK